MTADPAHRIFPVRFFSCILSAGKGYRCWKCCCIYNIYIVYAADFSFGGDPAKIFLIKDCDKKMLFVKTETPLSKSQGQGGENTQKYFQRIFEKPFEILPFKGYFLYCRAAGRIR